MRYLRIIALLTLVSVVACESQEKKTPSGYEYVMLNDAGNEVAADSSFLILNMKFVDQDDSVWRSTAETGVPNVIIKQDSVWKANARPLEESLLELGKDDSIKITLPANELFQNGPLPEGLTEESEFTIYVGVENALDQEQFQTWQQDMMRKQQEKAQADRSEQLEKDKETIQRYLQENNIDAQTTESGLSYVIKEEGTGQEANPGDSVRVNYAGYVLGGDYFDTSYEELAKEKGIFNPQRPSYGPFTFVLGKGNVIRGWDEGIDLLSEGGKATLYIPSSLGYGPRQRGDVIGPNSILVFDVELVEVKK